MIPITTTSATTVSTQVIPVAMEKAAPGLRTSRNLPQSPNQGTGSPGVITATTVILLTRSSSSATTAATTTTGQARRRAMPAASDPVISSTRPSSPITDSRRQSRRPARLYRGRTQVVGPAAPRRPAPRPVHCLHPPHRGCLAGRPGRSPSGQAGVRRDLQQCGQAADAVLAQLPVVAVGHDDHVAGVDGTVHRHLERHTDDLG